MGNSSEPEIPAYQGGITRIGGRDVATNTKEGNNIVSTYNPTSQEQQAYDITQSALPSLYEKALGNTDFTDYVNNYTNDQYNQASKNYQRQLGDAASQLVSSGQLGSSQNMNTLTPFNEAYQAQLANIAATAPQYAQQLRANDQAYNTNAMANAINSLNNYYGNQNTFTGQANTLSNMGNNYTEWAYPNQVAAYQREQADQNAKNSTYMQLGGAALQTAAQILPIVLASDKRIKKNINKIGKINGTNIYTFEYKDGYNLPNGTQLGVMAQEVEQKYPDTVIEINGIKHVNYSKLLEKIA